MIGQILSLKEGTPGLADYLSGEAISDQIISETDIPNLVRRRGWSCDFESG